MRISPKSAFLRVDLTVWPKIDWHRIVYLHWFFILLDTWFVKISSEKSFVPELVFEGNNEFVWNPVGEHTLCEGEHDGLHMGLESFVSLHVSN